VAKCAFTIEKDHFSELELFLASFKSKDEEVIKIVADKTGIHFTRMEMGIVGCCSLPIIATSEIVTYVRYSTFANFFKVAIQPKISFEFQNESLLSVLIDEVVLNVSPALYDGLQFEKPDITLSKKSVKIPSDKMKAITSMLHTPSSADAVTTPLMMIGKTWQFGNSTNTSVLSVEETKDVNWHVSHLLMKYMASASKMASDITLSEVPVGDEKLLVVTNSYTTYWTNLSSLQSISLDEIFKAPTLGSLSVADPKRISASLDKLFIPLAGAVAEPLLSVSKSGNESKIRLQVSDLGNRISHDSIEVPEIVLNEVVNVNFVAFASAIRKMTAEDKFTITVKESTVIFTQHSKAGTYINIIYRYVE
jgi:hypothetical protein